ncbi:hypothetical protein R3P38DRAFT_2857654 [Favolaschia claudopus]|uniref:Uncharacterized protein n=1 Tax=Favolaschia claudopus TaxID=2862362 RepID=A0AAW0DK31_9AGAR
MSMSRVPPIWRNPPFLDSSSDLSPRSRPVTSVPPLFLHISCSTATQSAPAFPSFGVAPATDRPASLISIHVPYYLPRLFYVTTSFPFLPPSPWPYLTVPWLTLIPLRTLPTLCIFLFLALPSLFADSSSLTHCLPIRILVSPFHTSPTTSTSPVPPSVTVHRQSNYLTLFPPYPTRLSVMSPIHILLSRPPPPPPPPPPDISPIPAKHALSEHPDSSTSDVSLSTSPSSSVICSKAFGFSSIQPIFPPPTYLHVHGHPHRSISYTSLLPTSHAFPYSSILPASYPHLLALQYLYLRLPLSLPPHIFLLLTPILPPYLPNTHLHASTPYPSNNPRLQYPSSHESPRSPHPLHTLPSFIDPTTRK